MDEFETHYFAKVAARVAHCYVERSSRETVIILMTRSFAFKNFPNEPEDF